MRIAEIFYSLQGEGKRLGVPSVFIRISGCNLRCHWCDTPYASWQPTGPQMSIEEILKQVREYACNHVVITGGEPLLFPELVELVLRVKQEEGEGKHITIETAGTLWQEFLSELQGDLLSISPKLSNSTPWDRGQAVAESHEKQRINLDVLVKFAKLPATIEKQWKFVIAEKEDLVEVQLLLSRIRELGGMIEPQDVLLMPEGITREAQAQKSLWVAELCKQCGYRFAPRLHISLYGNQRGT